MTKQKGNIASLDQSFSASGIVAFNSKGELIDKLVIRTQLDSTTTDNKSVCSFDTYWDSTDYITALVYDFLVKNKCEALIIERPAFGSSGTSGKRLSYLFDFLVDFFSKRGYDIIQVSSSSHQSLMQKKSGLHVKKVKWSKAKQKQALEQCYPEIYNKLQEGIKVGLTDLVDAVTLYIWYEEIGQYKEEK